jgi:hypothetical protein
MAEDGISLSPSGNSGEQTLGMCVRFHPRSKNVFPHPMTIQKNGDKSKITEQIDENLRRVYQEAFEEEIPDRFRELLQRLQAKEAEL